MNQLLAVTERTRQNGSSFGRKNDVITSKRSNYVRESIVLESKSHETNFSGEQDSSVYENCELPESYAVVEHKKDAQIASTNKPMVINCEVTNVPVCSFSTRGDDEQLREQKIVGHRCRGKDDVDLLVSIGPSGSGAYIWVPRDRFLRKHLIDKYLDGCGKRSAGTSVEQLRAVAISSRSMANRVILA